MARRLTIDERLTRATDLLRRAQQIEVPPRGRERVGPLLRKRSLLAQVYHYAAAIASQRTSWARAATFDQLEHARALLALAEQEWPLPQDQTRGGGRAFPDPEV